MSARTRCRVAPPRAAAVLVGAVASIALVSCGPDAESTESDRGDVSIVSASQVGGDVTGDGADLLGPATPTCAVDGPFLWEDAADGGVKRFERTVDGAAETVTVGAWPMSEASAEAALGKIGPGPGCSRDGVVVESVSIGAADGPRTRSFEVRRRDASNRLTSWQVRAYSYVDDHLVTVWVERADSQPSLDGVRTLLDRQRSTVERS